MDLARFVHASGVRACCALLPVVIACSSDPPGRLPAQGGASGAGGASGQTAGVGGQGISGDAPVTTTPISPPFNPTPPVALTEAWLGTVVPEYSENYTFRVSANAPVRALVDGEQILRDFTAQGSRVAAGSIWLAAGSSHELKVEIATPDPGLIVEWESPSKPRRAVPKSMLAEAGLSKLDAVAPFFNGVFPKVTPSSAAVKAEQVSGNLNLRTVMGIASHPNLSQLYIVGRFGEVKAIDPSTPNDTGKVFIDLSQGLFTGQDSGVMNLAFHPEYAQAGSPNRNYFYVYYVADMGGAQFVRLSRFTSSDDHTSANRNTEQILIQERLSTTFHRGGGMTFGKDGFLYVGLGDFGNPNNGQDIKEHLAAGVLRIDVDQNPAKSHAIPKESAPNDEQTFNRNYGIPNDNPFVGQPGVLEEYYTLGERNPHRLTMDPATGRLLVGNVGGNETTSQEEINEVVKGGNYGWPFREGDRELGSWTFNASGQTFQITGRPATLAGTLTEPNLLYKRPSSCIDVATQCPDLGAVPEGKCVIGGYVYRGSALPQLDGRYILSDCTNGKLWATKDEYGHGPMEELFTSPFIEVVTLGQDRDGEVYFAGTAGEVYRLAPSGPPVADPPNLLSQTGVFADLPSLTPAAGVIPFDVSTPLWSDDAHKARWLIVPSDGQADSPAEQIDATGNEWGLPVGSVLVKHFELAQDDDSVRRLETRFLVHGEDKRYYGVTYRWRPDGSDAELQGPKAFLEAVGDQVWHYPSRSECGRCHNSAASYVLGPNAPQLNRPVYYPGSGLTANALGSLQALGLFQSPLMPASLPHMPSLHEGTAFAEERARAYLSANCAHCHRPDGPGRGEWDARFSTALSEQNLIGVDPIEALGLTGAKLLAPQSPDTSVVLKRIVALDGSAMPPLAKSVVDESAVSVFTSWLSAMNAAPGAATPVATDNLTLTVAANAELPVLLAGSDADGDSLDFRISRMPVHGTLHGFGKDLVYRPHPDFTGVDAFSFITSDGAHASAAGSVQLTVTP